MLCTNIDTVGETDNGTGCRVVFWPAGMCFQLTGECGSVICHVWFPFQLAPLVNVEAQDQWLHMNDSISHVLLCVTYCMV